MAGSGDDRSRRRRLEGVIPDLLKRAVEIGVERASEAPDSIKQFVNERKIPKEVAQLLFTQIEDTKNGILRVVGNEVRDFLEHTNLASDVHKLLTSVQFEINTTIRFTPNEPGAAAAAEAKAAKDENQDESGTPSSAGEAQLPKPEVKTDVFVSKRESRRRSRE